MARARRAEGAPGGARERSRAGGRRRRANVLGRSRKLEPIAPAEEGDAAEGISRLERLVRERTGELQEVNAALRASESTLRSFYESAPLMMGVVEVPADNSDIIHIYGNPATERFFGRPPGSTAGQSALRMGAPEEAVRRWVDQYRLSEREGRPVQFEYWHPRERGAVWLSAVVARIGPAGCQAIL